MGGQLAKSLSAFVEEGKKQILLRRSQTPEEVQVLGGKELEH